MGSVGTVESATKQKPSMASRSLDVVLVYRLKERGTRTNLIKKADVSDQRSRLIMQGSDQQAPEQVAAAKKKKSGSKVRRGRQSRAYQQQICHSLVQV